MNGTKATIDHDTIRHWAEERGAWPARVKGTGGRNDVGMIRLDFPGFSGKESLEQISWDDFFDKFDESNLALVYRDELTSGGRSNFNKLVGRETIDVSEGSGRRTGMARRRAKQAARGGAAQAKSSTRRAPARGSAAKTGGRKRAAGATKRAGAARAGGGAKKASATTRSTAGRGTTSRAPAKRKAAQRSPRGGRASTRATGRTPQKGSRQKARG